jgi:adenosine deaminase/adenosine deaminase CECR1
MRTTFIGAWLALLVIGTAIIWRYPSKEGPHTDIGATISEQKTAQYFESIRNQPEKFLAFLRNMPKGGDLHNHLSGAVYAETFVSWAAKGGKCIDPVTFVLSKTCKKGYVKLSKDLSKNDPVFYRRMIDAWSTRNWEHSGRSGHDQFFATFGRWDSLTARTGDMLAEVRSRAAAGNVSYLEIMLTPDGGESKLMADRLSWSDSFGEMRQQLLRAGLIEKAVGAGKRALDKAEENAKKALRCGQTQADAGCNVEVRYIFQVGRTNSPVQVFAQMLAAFELPNYDTRIVGLNLVQPEDNQVAMRDFSLQMKMLDYFHSIYSQVHIALHAGELAPGLVPPEALRFHIRDSVEIGHAERIGHGTDLMQESDADKLVQEMAARNVMVEICLTSNDVILGIRGEKHPLRKYLEAGVPVALATDDEGVSRSEMTREYLKAAEDQRLGYLDLKKMTRISLEHAFISGKSLWKNERPFELSWQCFGDRPERDTLSSQCQQFLNSSEKARLQWRLEKSFVAFENQYQ